jgi:MATE family multidrug resistance protein
MSLHYGTPSSLTSDYGVLARYAAARAENREREPNAPQNTDDHDQIAEDDMDEDDALLTPRPRFPTPYRALPATLPSTLPPGMKDSVANENTPLLIPRISEEGDGDAEDPDKRSALWVEEVRILCRYTLPVFGTYVIISFFDSKVC